MIIRILLLDDRAGPGQVQNVAQYLIYMLTSIENLEKIVYQGFKAISLTGILIPVKIWIQVYLILFAWIPAIYILEAL